MHGLIALFLEVIVLAMIRLFVGLAALQVPVIASRAIVALIVLMTIVRLVIIAIVSVAPMIVAIFVAIMLLVAQFTATHGRKMSRFLPLWLLLVLVNLLKNASHLVGHLTLLEESDKLERVSRPRLVQVNELELKRLGLRKEDLFTLLLHRGYFHCLTEVVTLQVAEKLHLMPHELVHWHESGLLGHTKLVNQLVAYIGKTGNSLEVILDTFVKDCLCTICIVWTFLHNDAAPFGQVYVLKVLTHKVKQ
jgi:hypothetical protein